MKSQTPEKTIGQGCKNKPGLKPFLEAFEPLLTQRGETAKKLKVLMADAGIAIAADTATKPFLPENLPAGLGPFVRMAAQDLLQPLYTKEVIAAHKNNLETLFLQEENDQDREALVRAMLAPSADDLRSLAKKYGLDPSALEFVSEFIISAVLRALAAPWQDKEFEEWRKGVCPVCGTPPIIAWLGKKPVVEKNEFLADGGGRKHLHCGICGTDWYFMRGICPGCGTQGEDAMQIFGEEDRRHERIDWCKKCHSYLPLIDLRELAEIPDMDAMALCLLYLDLFAAEKDLMPLKPSFWNMF